MKRFLPYYKKYTPTLVLDLICASLTTVCEIILPLIMKQITNAATGNIATLTLGFVLRVGILYFVLRIIDSLAYYYMAYNGHVMGTKIETDMRRDAYSHLHKLSDTYFNNTKIGQIMGRITNDLFDVTEFSHHCPEEFLIAGIKGIASFVILSFSFMAFIISLLKISIVILRRPLLNFYFIKTAFTYFFAVTFCKIIYFSAKDTLFFMLFKSNRSVFLQHEINLVHVFHVKKLSYCLRNTKSTHSVNFFCNLIHAKHPQSLFFYCIIA